MTPEEIQRTMDFILASQADSVVRMEKLEHREKKFQAKFESSRVRFQEQDERLQAQIDGLIQASRHLLESGRLTSRRLDRLEKRDG